jgi:hypothetical protein
LTFEGDPNLSGSTVLKTLVVVMIVVVTWWASTGGLDSIDVPTTMTTVPETTTTSA